jgi:hypothetical protein
VLPSTTCSIVAFIALVLFRVRPQRLSKSNEALEWYSHLVESKLRANVTNGQTFGGKGRKMPFTRKAFYIKAKEIIAAFLVWLNINLFK